MAENTQVIAENSRVIAENRRVIAENSRVIAENSRVIAENARAFEDIRHFLAQQTQALRGLTKEIKEFGAEMAAQRQALFRILDKLD
jgi:uncharacterized coiled-coil protein SlyX